ncbi:MAG: SDR family oxidoreductase [Candidatus Daviesbacteria bacterium]|nr:SDR family oxidoreductase [Candidatus Daviesbacteria bacterium]
MAGAKLIVFGGSGLVGREFIRQAKNEGISAPSHNEVDLRDSDALKRFLSGEKAPTVINFVGHTNLPEAEKERNNKEGEAWQLNVNVAENIAEACARENKFLIQISTDGVFPGTEAFPGPYSEDTEPIVDPADLSWYGYTKLMGEKRVKEKCEKSAIVRISHPFGNASSQKDFARKVIGYIQAGYVLFDDQYFTPTYLRDLAKVLLKIASAEQTGVFHVVCSELTTPFKFAEHIARNRKLEEEVKMGKIDEWARQNPNHYPRVKHGGLNTLSTQTRLGIKFHTWQEALDEFLPEIT